VTALRRGIDCGMTHIDTAEMYGSGVSEECVGEAIAGRRHDVFIVSKVLPSNASRAGTIAACERTLKRLKVDSLDCYLLHWRSSHPLEGTIAAFETLRRDGKIQSWGVSNFDVADLEEARALSTNMACNQVLYHLNQRAIEHEVVPWCKAHGVAVVAYSPFGQAHGFPAARSKGGQVLEQIAKRHRATARQVALSYLTREPNVFAIPKAASLIHVLENAKAGDLKLSESEHALIEDAFPLGRKPRQLPMI
jgi:diketogulonate reductase-like aldo/keto reductase